MALPLDQFRRNFRGYAIPSLLEALFSFDTASDQWYSGGFELSVISQQELEDHIQEESVSQFFGIGHDANYSIYALWRYQDMSLEEAPVVYLNSEGQGSRVFANTFSEFLTLLAYDEEPVFGEYSQKEEEIEHTSRNLEFRAWLQEQYHLHAAVNPNEVVHNAEQHHPRVPLIYEEWRGE